MDKQEINKAVLQWMDTQDPDLWKSHVHPYLIGVAHSIVNKHAGSKLPFQDDVINDITVHVALKLLALKDDILKGYKDGNGKGYIGGYIYAAIKRQYFNTYRTYTKVVKRGDFRNVIPLVVIDEEDKTGEGRIVDYPEPVEDYAMYKDQEFIKFYCEWWKLNLNLLPETSKQNVARIIGFIEAGITDKQEIDKKLGGYRKMVDKVFNVMRPYTAHIIRLFEGKKSLIAPPKSLTGISTADMDEYKRQYYRLNKNKWQTVYRKKK